MEFLQNILDQFKLDPETIWIAQVFIIVLITQSLSFIPKRLFLRIALNL